MSAVNILDRSNPPAMPGQTRGDPRVWGAARIAPESFNPETNTVDVIWTTGQEVLRFDYGDWCYYYEGLRVDEASCDLSRLNGGAAVLDTHNDSELARQFGVVTKAWIENGIGYATLRLSTAPRHADLVHDVKDGIIQNISVRYQISEWEITQKDGEIEKRTATKWQPNEISFVAVPADAGCQARALEFTAARNAAETEQAGQTATNEETPGTPAGDEETTTMTEAEIAAARAANAARKAGIRELGRKHKIDEATIDQFVDDEARTVDQFALHILSTAEARSDAAADEQARGLGTPNGTRSGTQNEISPTEKATLMTDALVASSLGRAVKDPRANQFIERASEGHFGFTDLARVCAEDRGIRIGGNGGVGLRQVITGLASEQRSNMGFHTSGDFAGITSNALGVIAMERYADLAADSTVERFGSTLVVPDFRVVRTGTFGSFTELKHVPENGELKGLDMGIDVLQGRISKFGGIFGITMEAIYNDSTGELADQGANLAASARDDEAVKAIEQLVDGNVVVENPKDPRLTTVVEMWSGDNTVTAPTLYGAMALARNNMRNQRMPNTDRQLNLEGRILLVSGDLEDQAAALQRQVYNATAGEANVNIDANGRPRYEVVVDSRLPDGTAYLFASKDRAKVFRTLKLRGMEGVQVWQIADPQRLGMSWGVLDPIAFMFGARYGAVRMIITG